MNIKPKEVEQAYLIEESNVEVLDKGEQRQTRNTTDNEMDNEESY